MKTKSSTVITFTFACKGTRIVARLIGMAVLALALFIGLAGQGATVISNVSNAAVYLGLPSTSVEFENPLNGTERVLDHALLEWRDADYAAGPPPWYDDWSVFTAGGTVDGNAAEIWMRAPGQYIWTITTVPSTLVSIHMTGDNNDGLAEVCVDGVMVAQLDMYNPPPGSQTVLILVRGLANTTHTIKVKDTGPNQQGMTDVHTFGAAALKENPIKWNQPPVPATNLTNVFYNGWNQPSAHCTEFLAADDWVCTNAAPVTKIRWWGSYSNWAQVYPPSPTPYSGFYFRFWNDVPAGVDAPYSHPGTNISWTFCTNVASSFVGWDYDPRTGTYESCFMFETTNPIPTPLFVQAPGTNIYWLSIEARQIPCPSTTNIWGWKTRSRDPNSQAPDAAVSSPNGSVSQPSWQPIYWPAPTNSWDLAFELISEQTIQGASKWDQPPDLSTNGADVKDTAPPPFPGFLLANSFLCTTPSFITNITIWGSWTNDVDWSGGVTFTLSIHADDPTNHYPGQTLWLGIFGPGQFGYSAYANNITEWWFVPPNFQVFPGDHTCFQYDFNVPTNTAFWQAGTAGNPKVYWLDVQAQLQNAPAGCSFGWKTSSTNLGGHATWVANAMEPYNGSWSPLSWAGNPANLAFRLNGSGGGQHITEVKWSQPPVPAEDVNIFIGWNEMDHYGESQIIADDWACTTTNPVTDIHWWGSFLNWSGPTMPQLPDAFYITFWTDTPAVTNQPGSFSHPNLCQWMIICTNYTCEFAGWDWDPRNPNGIPETCFRFDQDLSTNEWFYQNPKTGTNIYWISISAFYANPSAVLYPWGWETRPHDTNSLAPDDAVRIVNPTAPVPGMLYQLGQPIYWPYWTNSWDMAFVLTTTATEDQDFGDAPNPYPTLLTNNGARHFILPGFCLGSLIDAETNGLPNWNATGDNTNNLADEDGVIFTPPVFVGTQSWVKVALTSPTGTGQLDAWVDFNRNGGWEAGEKVFDNLTLLSGTNNLSFQLPTNAVLGPTFARFRLSSTGGLLPTGAAADGEVEDYMITIMQYRPATNIVITNIVAAVSNVTVRWRAETNIHYLLQATTNLSAPTTWSNVGPEVIGPANNQTETNALQRARFYRVIAPYTWP